MCSDHPKFTTGGSVSNHALGRGLDIASVDGEIVNPGSAAARELASELSQLPEQYRPDEIGSPWPISGPGYFTDGAHQDHVHLGFKQEIDPSWAPPADVAAKGGTVPAPDAGAAAVASSTRPSPAPAVAGTPAPAAPVATAAAAPPAPKAGDSGRFMAATAHRRRPASRAAPACSSPRSRRSARRARWRRQAPFRAWSTRPPPRHRARAGAASAPPR